MKSKTSRNVLEQYAVLDGFTLDDWLMVLKGAPEMIGKCPVVSCFEIDEWYRLLDSQPCLADHCPCLEGIPAWDWIDLLRYHPELDRACCKWADFKGRDWWSLLENQPQLAEKCNWQLLNPGDWACLLTHQPGFANKCKANNFAAISRIDWEILLKAQPQFVDKCPIVKDIKDPDVWVHIVSQGKKWDRACPCWKEFDKRQWLELISKRTDLFDKCPFVDELDFDDWIEVLQKNPQLADRFSEWDDVSDWGWLSLLEAQPTLATYCQDWLFEGGVWKSLIRTNPAFEGKCQFASFDDDWWDDFLVEDWQNASIPAKSSLFFERCPHPEKLSAYTWKTILIKRPELGNACKCWKKFDHSDWIDLLAAQPQFAVRFKDLGKIEVSEWVELLSKQSQLAEYCQCWDKFQKRDWVKMLSCHPNIAEFKVKTDQPARKTELKHIDIRVVGPGTANKRYEIVNKRYCGRVNISQVIISEQIVKIGVSAFAKCLNLESVDMECASSLQILRGAFSGCNKLLSVTMPNLKRSNGGRQKFGGKGQFMLETGARAFPIDVFRGCDKLKSVTMVGKGDYLSVDGVLYSADGTMLMFYPNASEVKSLPDSVSIVLADAFEHADDAKRICEERFEFEIIGTLKGVNRVACYCSSKKEADRALSFLNDLAKERSAAKYYASNDSRNVDFDMAAELLRDGEESYAIAKSSRPGDAVKPCNGKKRTRKRGA